VDHGLEMPKAARQVGHVKFKVREATTGFEPVIAVLQTAALPLGYVAEDLKSGTRNCTCV
jgi:hypothetical protein